ncbi:MAG: DUF1361 domain-containing protein [Peptoniphilaceae bacterium]
MNQESVRNFKKIFIYLIIYIVLSSLIIYFDINRRYLIFNVGLSFIAYIMSNVSLSYKNKYAICALSLIITILFYPNTIYMFTDLIHIKSLEYYEIVSAKAIYSLELSKWIKLSCDSLMVTLSLILGFESFINMLKTVRCYRYKIASFILLVLVSGMSGLAIYIGRFLRFNSWDIKSFKVIIDYLLNNLTMNDYYLIATFSIVHFIVIILFANMKSN